MTKIGVVNPDLILYQIRVDFIVTMTYVKSWFSISLILFLSLRSLCLIINVVENADLVLRKETGFLGKISDSVRKIHEETQFLTVCASRTKRIKEVAVRG